MTIHAIYTRATMSQITNENLLGWTPEWGSLRAIVDDARLLKTEHPNVDGIVIQRFAGALPSGRIAGARPDGSIVGGMTVGALGQDYSMTADDLLAIEQLRGFGLSVRCYAGFPTTNAGAISVLRFPHDNADLVVDMSGVNLATASLIKRCPLVIEPYPRAKHRAKWFTANMPSHTMIGYWQKHLGVDSPPPRDWHHIAFNAGDDHNAWDSDLAADLHRKGYAVDVPQRFAKDFAEGLK